MFFPTPLNFLEQCKMPDMKSDSKGDKVSEANYYYNPDDPHNLNYSPYHNPLVDRRAKSRYYRFSPDISDQEWEIIKDAPDVPYNPAPALKKFDAMSPSFSTDNTSYPRHNRRKHRGSSPKPFTYHTKPYARHGPTPNHYIVTNDEKRLE
ncbi:Protein of unknown function [Pyronema omphalodes CBS 100304]|uniref:Uncharacterized protein n=1 Tax=Pyronema omphalodes (strain CBS 100304) TaxID=1076935 RepID=U4LDQ9_PYROM|nr:Protein of unknown function [Pyronema omphalodes CBS 100304]